jgi:hypothetical protein
MPHIKPNRIGVTVYLTPETYRALEDMRNPYISTSAHCAMILDEVVGMSK